MIKMIINLIKCTLAAGIGAKVKDATVPLP